MATRSQSVPAGRIRCGADDEPVALTSEDVSGMLIDALGRPSEYWTLIGNETIRADSRSSNRIPGTTPAVSGQLQASATWHRVTSERLYGSPASSAPGEAKAEFFSLASAPTRRAA
jgi:hypothetical protein